VVVIALADPVVIAERVLVLVRAGDLPGAARELRRLEREIAAALDRENAPRSHIASAAVRR
jgi:hypothetical protein